MLFSGFSECSRIVSTSASICVGWNSLLSPLYTGTPANWASCSTTSWPNPRYSIASNIRPRTRAVSLIDSFCPICELSGPR